VDRKGTGKRQEKKVSAVLLSSINSIESYTHHRYIFSLCGHLCIVTLFSRDDLSPFASCAVNLDYKALHKRVVSIFSLILRPV